MIDSYRFGRIVIDGVIYTSDVIICPNRVISNWWRESGHLLKAQDLSEVICEPPSVLVIGTGAYGLMKVDSTVSEALKSKHIQVIIERTEPACGIYNKLIPKGKKTAAALHLTC